VLLEWERAWGRGRIKAQEWWRRRRRKRRRRRRGVCVCLEGGMAER
jgi:hypothetical protein